MSAIVFIAIGCGVLAHAWHSVDHERRISKLEAELKDLKDWLQS